MAFICQQASGVLPESSTFRKPLDPLQIRGEVSNVYLLRLSMAGSPRVLLSFHLSTTGWERSLDGDR